MPQKEEPRLSGGPPLIVQRELDGMFDVVCGDIIAGPFPTITFAMQIATGEKPANIRNDVGGKFRRHRIVREVLHDA